MVVSLRDDFDCVPANNACHCEPVLTLVWQSVSPCLPLGEGGSRVPRKRETDEGYLPLPMGEVSRRGGEGMFTLSVTP